MTLSTFVITIIVSLIASALVVLWLYKEAKDAAEFDERFDKVMYELTLKKKYGEHL